MPVGKVIQTTKVWLVPAGLYRASVEVLNEVELLNFDAARVNPPVTCRLLAGLLPEGVIQMHRPPPDADASIYIQGLNPEVGGGSILSFQSDVEPVGSQTSDATAVPKLVSEAG